MFLSINSIGETIEVIPITAKMLNIFDPIKLPIAKLECFFIAATIEVANSGIDVPKATILIEINLSEILYNSAILSTPFIKKFDPNDNKKTPSVRLNNVKNIDSLLCFSLNSVPIKLL